MWWFWLLLFAWLLIYGVIDSVKESKKEKERIRSEKSLNSEWYWNYTNNYTENNSYKKNNINNSIKSNYSKNDWTLNNQGSVRTWKSYYIKEKSSNESIDYSFTEPKKRSYKPKDYVIYNWTLMTREEAVKAREDH